MDMDAYLMLAGEACDDLELLARALQRDCAGCITDISESHRRCTSAVADVTARLFSVFVPPLPRGGMAALAQELYGVVGAIFAASLLLPSGQHADSRWESEMSSLCRMAEQLRRAVQTLPQFARGKQPPSPDTYAFYAEENKLRAAHALRLMHGDRTLQGRGLSDAVGKIGQKVESAYGRCVQLMLESL